MGGGELAEWFSLVNPTGWGDVPTTGASAAAPPAPSAANLTELVERWVRRAALGGDQRRGAVRLDIGHGRFAGSELLIVAEAGSVSVELRLPPDQAEGGLADRLQTRLARRGFSADVSVR